MRTRFYVNGIQIRVIVLMVLNLIPFREFNALIRKWSCEADPRVHLKVNWFLMNLTLDFIATPKNFECITCETLISVVLLKSNNSS